MTIKVHPDAVVQLKQSSSSSIPDDYLIYKEPLAATYSRGKNSLPTDDDTCTVDTVYTTDSDESVCPRVSFADNLVTDAWTRPPTLQEDVRGLYYSREEIERFRQEYRMERKLLNSIEEDNDVLSQPRATNEISRVVVLHEDQINVITNDDFFDTPQFWSGSITWW